ncbi:MAG TPA: HEAT repeat domain-containing protein, partial [Kofleriaceae bacterium]|nr:HEAT repeat domain-containing protein [Kofleriaceae bacterium]
AGSYRNVLAQALAADQGELRRLAFAAARQLPDEASQALYREALALDPDPVARRELLGLITTDAGVAAPTASSAMVVLAQKDASPAARDKARTMLRRAFASAPAEAAAAAAKLIGDEEAPEGDRVLAFELLLELAPPETFGELVGPTKAAMASKKTTVQAAALPLYARVSPQDAAGDLALMLENTALPVDLKVAMALAWGEVAATKNKAAQGALETLVEDPNPRVRAAAARAYGYVGRAAQDKLFKMVKGERYDVAMGAAWGLANSADAGASAQNAAGGIYQLWKRKGKPKRDAARVYARMARTRPGVVTNYLAGAAVSTEDPGLHPIAVEGLCNALAAGDKGAAGDLARSVRAGEVEVRRMIIECVADNPKQLAATGRIALDMADDPDGQARAEAARVLAAMAAGGKASKDVGAKLSGLAKDDTRDVRIIAIRALAAMGAAAPPAALEALPRAFESGDEAERLVILRAAREMGGGELVQMAAADPSPLVRMAAIDTAIATKSGVGATLSSALSDQDPAVRRAAVEQLAGTGHGLGPDEVDRALALAVRDENEALSVQALTTMARIGDPAQVAGRLKKMFDSPSERERARAAAAARGLAERDATAAKAAIALLEPLYDDPSRDVRAAMLRSLATAYAGARKPDELVSMLRDSEARPTRRLVVAGAFLLLAGDAARKDAAINGLEEVVEDGPPLGKLISRLALGLIEGSADGFAFLTRLVQ